MKVFLFLLMFSIPLMLYSQTTDYKPQQADTTQGKSEQGKNYNVNFSFKSTEAVYPGGNDSLFAQLFNAVVFSPEAVSAKVIGVVKVAFDVTFEGKVKNVIVFSGVGYGIDEQIEKALNSMIFIPAQSNGTAFTSQQFLEIPLDYSVFVK